ncbi:MAG: hypothetical protein MR871_04825 [Lachnospiraceae bacterium]|nr:hypothetical protein [Lachnospiraceae bacterium]
MGGIGNRRESLQCDEFEKNERNKLSATAQNTAQKMKKVWNYSSIVPNPGQGKK